MQMEVQKRLQEQLEVWPPSSFTTIPIFIEGFKRSSGEANIHSHKRTCSRKGVLAETLKGGVC